MIQWEGMVCVVTGASSGIGREACLEFAARGATVIAVARREERLAALVDELGSTRHSYVVCDVSDLDQVRAMAKTLGERTDHVDLLLNNAGIRSTGPLTRTTSEGFERVIRTNLLGAIWCTKELLPLLEAAPRTPRTPVVVNLASMAGRLPTPKASDYAASKFGLVGFTESLWHDIGPRGIRVMMVNPGLIDTEGFSMKKAKASAFSWAVMEPDRVVRALIRGVERGAFEVRVQWWMHPLYHLAVAVGPTRRVVAGLIRKKVSSI
jgi:NAD(P)-dependent dehydrogenase (short-subunit alcohol dehydrogenase family)